MNMPCPKCKGKTKIIDTRLRDTIVRRRRECVACKYRFFTKEVIMKEVKRKPIAEVMKTKKEQRLAEVFAKYGMEVKK